MIISYVKKSDVREVADNQRKMSVLTLSLFILVFAIMQIFIAPAVLHMYGSSPFETPIVVQTSKYVAGVIILAGLVYLVRLLSMKPDYSGMDAIARKHKSKMIDVRKLVDYKSQWFLILLVSVGVSHLILSVVLPVYWITKHTTAPFA